MQIKAGLGRLVLQRGTRELVEEQRDRNGVRILPVALPHVLALEDLGDQPKDPFDRLLIARAIVEGLTLASKDEAFQRYSVSLVRDS